MTKSRNILTPRAIWTKEQEAIVLARYPHEKTEKIAADIGQTVEVTFRKAKSMGLKKTPEYLASPDACRLRRDNPNSVAHRFPKGHVPINKGIKGISYPGMEATQFKKGEKPHTWLPIGTELKSPEGYLMRKMTDTGVTRHDYIPVHRLLWIQHHGVIPAGQRLAFKDLDKTNITIDNLELVTAAEMMRRNTIHNLPEELKEVLQLKGALNRRITCHERHNRTKKSSV
jgi:hypothetical protein